MTFKHKLSCRLALMKDALPLLALVALGCEKPVALTDSNPATVTQVVVSPDSIDLDPLQTQQFTAFGRTATGDSMPITASWSASAGTITPLGYYVADSSETDAVVTATLDGSLTGNARIRKRRIVAIVVSPQAAVVAPGQTQQFTTYARRNTGDSVSVAVSYTATGGTMSPGGMYTAGQTPGSYRVIATRTRGGLADTAAITVMSLPVASVAVTPPAAAVLVGGIVQLTATPKDANGNPLAGRTVAWSSGATGVASVDANGLVKGVGAGTATITATSEGKSAIATITVSSVPVKSVVVTPSTATVLAGGMVQLSATPKDSAGNALTGRTVAWSSSATSVATVDANGLVKGVGAGSATITATSEGKSGTATITVTLVPVASVQVAPASPTVLLGQTVPLIATPKDSAGNPLTGRVGTWSSSATGVATVDVNGLVKGVGPGTATITATCEGKSGTATVTVSNVPVASVVVTPATASMFPGGTAQLTATPMDSAGNALTGRTVAWSSNATSVATIDANGSVKGVAAGSATITATSEGKSATATITVRLVPVASVQVSPATAGIRVGQTLQLSATTKDSAGGTLTGRTVTWASSNANVASVNTSGLVTGKAAGSATITATSEGKSATATVTVTLVPVASVVVSPTTATLPVGGTVQLAVTLKDSAANLLTGRSVTWASSAPTVATVSQAGLVTDVADGGATTITATSEGKSGTAAITVQASLPGGSLADPTLLPVASGQLSNVAAYAALNVVNQPAGFSYRDPVTGVKVWKVTSSSVPMANSNAGHDYSDGPNEVSLGWGPNNNTHTILIGAPQGTGNYYLVDFTSGVGLTNYRRLTVQPGHDLGVSFSNLASQPRIAYVMTNTQIVRYNTATMQVENTGTFPLDLSAVGAFSWLQHDKNDGWFAGLTNDQSVAFAWNSQTNQFLTHGETWLNEPRLERDGRYIALTNSNSTFRLWDLATNTFGPTQSDRLNSWLGHNANLRGQWVTTDVNASAPFDLDRYYPSGGQIVKTRFLNNSASSGVHHSGNWVQSDAELGGDLNRQWSFMSGVENDAFTVNAQWKQAIGVVRSDGSDARLVVHHYSASPTYYADPFAQPSPDGKVVIFNSNMNGSGRYDLFVAEIPLR